MIKKKNNKASYDVVIIGAGPYGLSTAARLKEKGLKIAIFGQPMKLWRDHMPKGMLLRSRWWDTSFSDNDYSIGNYLAYLRKEPRDPLASTTVINYGLWFQKHAVEGLDLTYIAKIEKKETSFSLTLSDGRQIRSTFVVMAPGLGYYVYRPEPFVNLSQELVSHTYDNFSFDRFKGKRVTIIGSGQSALENAALMSEAGITVHLIHRSPINWLNAPVEKTFSQYLRSPKAPISDGWDNWLLGTIPYTFQRLPRSFKDYYLNGKGKNGPAGSHWLMPRISNVIIHRGQIQKIEPRRNIVYLALANNISLDTDHVILATGYRVNVKKLPMLDTRITCSLKTYKGSPILNGYFESSISGLYFTGISSTMSFGPLYRFIAGTNATGKRISESISHQLSL